MTKHMFQASAANRGQKGPGDRHEVGGDATRASLLDDQNASEQSGAANVKQNTTNKRYFLGRRIK
jgi:hypothetical protein